MPKGRRRTRVVRVRRRPYRSALIGFVGGAAAVWLFRLVTKAKEGFGG